MRIFQTMTREGHKISPDDMKKIPINDKLGSSKWFFYGRR